MLDFVFLIKKLEFDHISTIYHRKADIKRIKKVSGKNIDMVIGKQFRLVKVGCWVN